MASINLHNTLFFLRQMRGKNHQKVGSFEEKSDGRLTDLILSNNRLKNTISEAQARINELSIERDQLLNKMTALEDIIRMRQIELDELRYDLALANQK